MYEKEKQDCTQLLEKANWPSEVVKKGVMSTVCGACGSDLLKPVEDSYHEINLESNSCGNYEGPDSYAERVVSSALADEAYSVLKDGGSLRSEVVQNMAKKHTLERKGDAPLAGMKRSILVFAAAMRSEQRKCCALHYAATVST